MLLRKLLMYSDSNVIKLVTNHVVNLSDQLAEVGHRTNKNKIVGITLGVIIFGLIIFVSILIMKNPGIYTCITYNLMEIPKYIKQNMCHNVFIYPTNQIGVTRKVCSKICNTKPRKEDLDLTTFDLSVLVKATENFSSSNKLGEGGFGPVYKVTKIYKSTTSSTSVKYSLTISHYYFFREQ